MNRDSMVDEGARSRRAGVRARILAGALLAALAGPAEGQVPTRSGERPAAEALTLRGAVRQALDRNQQLVAARAVLDEAGGRVTEAWGAVYPSVDLSMDYTRNVSPAVNFLPAVIFDPEAGPDDQIAVKFGADNAWNGLISVEQAVFKPAVFIGLGAASRYESLQDEVVRGQVLSVVTQVRTAYYTLLLAQEQHRLTDNSVSRVRQTLTETQALHEAGLASEYDLLRLQVELANLEPNLQRAENAIRQGRRTLGIALNAEDMEAIRVVGALATMDLEDPAENTPDNRDILLFAGADVGEAGEEAGTTSLVGRAMDQRSDIRQAELTESLRHTEMRLAQTSYLPEIGIFGNYQITSSQNGAPDFFGQPRATAKRVGVQVTLPLFDGLGREARIDQRQANLRAAQAQSAMARDEAENEVRTLLDQVHEARARARGQRLAVGQAQRGFDIARAQYREGLGSQLEMIDAEVALRQSEFNYAQAVYDYLVAQARLDEAAGQVPMVGGGQ
jgi:outer membrane protein TolC